MPSQKNALRPIMCRDLDHVRPTYVPTDSLRYIRQRLLYVNYSKNRIWLMRPKNTSTT